MPDPREVQSSNADGAAGGLNVESAFADVDDETAVRLKREAKSQGDERREGGPSAAEMLTRPVPGGTQDEPQLTADQLNPAAGVAGEAEDPGFGVDER